MINGDIEWVMKQKHVEGRLEVFQIAVRSSILPSTVTPYWIISNHYWWIN